MFITNSPAPSRINSAELPQRDVTVWEFAIFGYFPCIIRTVRTRSFNHKHKHRKMAIFCYFFSRFFLFLELGIFLFKLGKKHTFWHWEHDRISVVKTGQKKPCDISPEWFGVVLIKSFLNDIIDVVDLRTLEGLFAVFLE